MNDPLALKLAEQEGAVAANFLLTGILNGELLTNNMRKKMWLYSKCHSPKSWLVKNGIPNSWWESSICCDFRLGEFNRQNNHQPMCWTLLVKWCVNGRKTSKNEQDLVAEIIKMQKEVQEYWQGVERQRWEIWHDNRDYIVVYNQPNELILKTT